MIAPKNAGFIARRAMLKEKNRQHAVVHLTKRIDEVTRLLGTAQITHREEIKLTTTRAFLTKVRDTTNENLRKSAYVPEVVEPQAIAA